MVFSMLDRCWSIRMVNKDHVTAAVTWPRKDFTLSCALFLFPPSIMSSSGDFSTESESNTGNQKCSRKSHKGCHAKQRKVE